MIHTILGVFVNTLTVNDKAYLLNRDNLTEPIQTILSQKQKIFLNFFWHFSNLYQILNICEKRMTLIVDVFREITARKSMVR